MLFGNIRNGRILCAERSGGTGTSVLNELVCGSVRPENAKSGAQDSFVGEIVMLNRNQNAYKALQRGHQRARALSARARQCSVRDVQEKRELRVPFVVPRSPRKISIRRSPSRLPSRRAPSSGILLFLPDNRF